jgi:hypothetical protein
MCECGKSWEERQRGKEQKKERIRKERKSVSI